MTSMNKVFLAGNITRNPEVRYISSGTAVADLGLAVNESYRNKAGETVEQTCFVDITVWGRQAETCGEYLSKGSPVLVEGRLQLDSWENKDGEKRSKLRVKADRVQFLGGAKRAEYGDAPAGSGTPAAVGNRPGAGAPPAGAPEDDDNLPF